LAVGLLCGLCLGREKGQLEGKNGQVEGTKGHGARFFFFGSRFFIATYGVCIV